MSKRSPDSDFAEQGPSKFPRENGAAEDSARNVTRQIRGRDMSFPKITYRETGPLPNLEQLWRLDGDENQIIEVIISPDSLSKDNKRVKSRQFWGDLIYHPDSDIVAILMHLGYYAPNLTQPPSLVAEARVHVRLLPPQGIYPSKSRFLKSREWAGSEKEPEESCSLKVERCLLVTRSANFIELPPCVGDASVAQPTVQPQLSDRQITTRHTGTKSKHSQEILIQFNLCNEPWLKYSLAAIADKGMKVSQLTSARLLSELLFVETQRERYQIAVQSQAPPEAGSNAKDLFTFSKCKAPLPVGLMCRLGMPLPLDQVELLHEGVAWEEFNWAANMLHIRGKNYPLKCINFLTRTKPEMSGE